MPKIETLKDILDVHKAEFVNSSRDNLAGLYLYGSFFYRDLNQKTSSFENLHGKNGLLDKTPDFIAVVNNLESAITELLIGKGQDSITDILALPRDTPFYFTLKTDKLYEIEHPDAKEPILLPYKVGLISTHEFMERHEETSSNIYLQSRLSKFVNTLHEDNDMKPILNARFNSIRNFFVDLTLSTMPEQFNGEAFLKKYIKITYMCEAYRVFDLFGVRLKPPFVKPPKQDIIYHGDAYMLEDDRTATMRHAMCVALNPVMESNPNIEVIELGADISTTKYARNCNRTPAKNILKFLGYNVHAARTSWSKNRVTNKAAGGNGLMYTMRKFNG